MHTNTTRIWHGQKSFILNIPTEVNERMQRLEVENIFGYRQGKYNHLNRVV